MKAIIKMKNLVSFWSHNKIKPHIYAVLEHMGRLVGLEPTSAGATIQCVNQLHHSRHVLDNNILKEN